jgi:hypothetical protein
MNLFIRYSLSLLVMGASVASNVWASDAAKGSNKDFDHCPTIDRIKSTCNAMQCDYMATSQTGGNWKGEDPMAEGTEIITKFKQAYIMQKPSPTATCNYERKGKGGESFADIRLALEGRMPVDVGNGVMGKRWSKLGDRPDVVSCMDTNPARCAFKWAPVVDTPSPASSAPADGR